MVKMNIIPVRTVKKKEAGISAEERKQLEIVNKERTFVIQAHLVKVMKAQKTYRYQNLTADVMRNITMFKCDPKMLKDQIEVLIRDEYMKRDENNRAILIYLPWTVLFYAYIVYIMQYILHTRHLNISL